MTMSLADKLAEIREFAKSRIPPAALAVMARATADLRDSGILANVIRPGQSLPDFALAGARGNVVRSPELLAHGPLVITVFRGQW
jgi:hypothetical protein